MPGWRRPQLGRCQGRKQILSETERHRYMEPRGLQGARRPLPSGIRWFSPTNPPHSLQPSSVPDLRFGEAKAAQNKRDHGAYSRLLSVPLLGDSRGTLTLKDSSPGDAVGVPASDCTVGEADPNPLLCSGARPPLGHTQLPLRT